MAKQGKRGGGATATATVDGSDDPDFVMTDQDRAKIDAAINDAREDGAEVSGIALVAAPAALAVPDVKLLPLTAIAESPWNTRKHFDQARLEELAQSMATTGQTTPVLVRPHASGHGVYELAAGHRRFRAAKLAGLTHLLAIVREMDDTAFLELLTIENLQREDVHPLEEADGYAAMMLQDRTYDVAKIAQRVGKSETYVYDRLKLRSLSEPVRELFFAGRITPAHAIELSRLNSEDQARVSDPDGGLWQGEGGRGLQESFELSDEEIDADPYLGLKVVSVRELKSWINEHVRFDLEAEHVAVLFPETKQAVTAAAETELKVVHITHNHYVQEDARDDETRTIGPRSWKRADGSEEAPTCDKSVLGVIVVGPGRGESFPVCLAKKSCRTHWGTEMRAAAKAAKERDAGSGKTPAAPREQSWEREQRLRNEAIARYKPAIPAITEAFAKAVAKLAPKPQSPLGQLLLPHQSRSKDARFAPGKTADDLVRHLAWLEVEDRLGHEYRWADQLPKLGKALGVDVSALVKAAQPKAADDQPAKTKKKAAPAKKAKARR